MDKIAGVHFLEKALLYLLQSPIMVSRTTLELFIL
jgi:hypothetical protein